MIITNHYKRIVVNNSLVYTVKWKSIFNITYGIKIYAAEKLADEAVSLEKYFSINKAEICLNGGVRIIEGRII